MKRTRFGAYAAFSVGIFFFLSVLTILLTSPGPGSLIDHMTYIYATIGMHYMLGLTGILGVMVVLAVSRMMEEHHGSSEWFTYAKFMGLIGFALLATNNFRQIGLDYEMLHQAQEPGQTQQSIDLAWAGIIELSPKGWLDFFLIGTWILTVSWKACRSDRKQTFYRLTGIIAALSFWLIVLGNMGEYSLLVLIGMGVGGLVMVPIWFGLNGLKLLRFDQLQRQERQQDENEQMQKTI